MSRKKIETQRKTKTLNITIKPIVKEMLKKEADSQNRSIANMTEEMIIFYCNQK